MKDSDPLYTDAQLSKYKRLIRQATRWLFSGDVTERLDAAANADDALAALGPRKRKASKISEKDLAVIVIDALSYHDGWISEENFAKKLHMGGKQVRKMLQFLGNQGFVAREHRRERKQGTKVESVAEQEGMVQEARQATYVCIDYPHFYDMLRLRLSLAKRQASQRIDGGEAVEPYACCSRDGVAPVCGRKYTTMDMLTLEMSDDGFYVCDACDNGIVAPDDVDSQQEKTGLLRIKRARYRRENATLRRNALVTALKPLEDQIKLLENVDPPDFGSFSDWAARRQLQLKSGQATAKETAGRGGGGRAHLDYGIDGPLTGDVGINIELDQGAGQTATGTVVSMEAAPDINASLPYFMQQPGSAGAGTGQGAAVEAKQESTPDEAQQQCYLVEFNRQYKEQLAKMQAEALAKVQKTEVKQEQTVETAAQPEPEGQAGPSAPSGAGDDMEWEDADDAEWEDA